MKPAHNKLFQGFSLFMLIFFSLSACLNNTDKGVHNSNNKVKSDSSGYNGVFKSYRDGYLYSEVTLKNGKKNGLSVRYYPGGGINTQLFYKDGSVLAEIPYVNGVSDVNKLEYLLTENGQSHIHFIEKPGYTGETKLYLIAEYITRSGNKKYITGKTILPSANLKY